MHQFNYRAPNSNPPLEVPSASAETGSGKDLHRMEQIRKSTVSGECHTFKKKGYLTV